MNKKGQIEYPIITFFVLVFGLLLLAPIMMKIFISIKDPISSNLGNLTSGGTLAKQNFDKVMNTAVNMWDKVIIFCFAIGIIILIISAILIDTNPIFVILYIFISFMFVLFAPNIIDSLDAIYNSAQFTTEVSYLPFVDSLRTHFIEWLIGIMVLTGIIIYGKIALFKGGSRG